eukprot:m.199064 g.199064  ORF g.199064 m.199064 type:complete len:471 (-) comp25160_c1_seq1:141-1553(-)
MRRLELLGGSRACEISESDLREVGGIEVTENQAKSRRSPSLSPGAPAPRTPSARTPRPISQGGASQCVGGVYYEDQLDAFAGDGSSQASSALSTSSASLTSPTGGRPPTPSHPTAPPSVPHCAGLSGDDQQVDTAAASQTPGGTATFSDGRQGDPETTASQVLRAPQTAHSTVATSASHSSPRRVSKRPGLSTPSGNPTEAPTTGHGDAVQYSTIGLSPLTTPVRQAAGGQSPSFCSARRGFPLERHTCRVVPRGRDELNLSPTGTTTASGAAQLRGPVRNTGAAARLSQSLGAASLDAIPIEAVSKRPAPLNHDPVGGSTQSPSKRRRAELHHGVLPSHSRDARVPHIDGTMDTTLPPGDTRDTIAVQSPESGGFESGSASIPSSSSLPLSGELVSHDSIHQQQKPSGSSGEEDHVDGAAPTIAPRTTLLLPTHRHPPVLLPSGEDSDVQSLQARSFMMRFCRQYFCPP